MNSKESRQSLIQTLIQRHDTGFDGELIEDAWIDANTPYKFVSDEHGNNFTQPHDYFEVVTVGGEFAGILVADESGRNVFEHDKSDLPHPIGLFVKEQYRGDGIASNLVHDFMTTVEQDTCVIDCNDSVMPFYEQLDCNVIYALSLKRDVDTSRYHELLRMEPDHRDFSSSSEHEIPYFTSHSDSSYYESYCLHNAIPAVYIMDDGNDPLCKIVVQMPYLTDGKNTENVCLTEEASAEINDVLSQYDDCAHVFEFKSAGADFFDFPSMLPDDTRALADDLYPILTDKSNMELRTDRLEFKLSDINSLDEKVNKASHCADCGHSIHDIDENDPLCETCR